MKTTTLNTIKDLIKEYEKDYNFNDYIINYIDENNLKECKNSIDVINLIDNANEDFEITDTEIIYFVNAIEYLKENNPSLQYSLELASDMWFEAKDLDSEKLASILASENNKDDFEKFKSKLKNALDDIEF